MTRTMSATEARKNFFKVMEMAQKPGLPVKITHEGHPAVIMMSEEEFEGWMETLEIMSDPGLVQQIRESEKDTETTSLEELVQWEHTRQPRASSRPPKPGKKRIRKPSPKGPAKGSGGALRHS